MKGDRIINVQIPSRTPIEYQRDNRERLRIYKHGRDQ